MINKPAALAVMERRLYYLDPDFEQVSFIFIYSFSYIFIILTTSLTLYKAKGLFIYI